MPTMSPGTPAQSTAVKISTQGAAPARPSLANNQSPTRSQPPATAATTSAASVATPESDVATEAAVEAAATGIAPVGTMTANSAAINSGKYGWGSSPRDYVQRKGACIGVYGAGKIGKTSTIGNVIESDLARPLLIFSANANPDSLVSIQSDDIEVIPITKPAEIDGYYDRIVREQGKFPFKSVSLDVVSEMLGLLEQKANVKPSNEYWQAYSGVQADMKAIVRKWRLLSELPNLRLNVFFVLWERNEEITLRGNKVKRAALDLNGAMRTSFAGMVPCLAHITEADTTGLVRIMDFRTAPTEHVGGWNYDQRAGADEVIRSIPREIFYGANDAPMADLVNTIRGGEAFPREQYTLNAALARARQAK